MPTPDTNTVHNSLDSTGRFARVGDRGAEIHQEDRPAWKQAAGLVEATIGKYPMAACGLAVAAGIVVGWWIKRR